MKAQCDKNCFACPYEDCIYDDLTYEDYKAEREIDLLSGAVELKTPPNIRAAQRKYREENKEKVAAAQRKYREENKEKVAAAQRKYREENIDDLKAYKRAWYQSNKERLRIKRQEKRRERRSGCL